MKFILSLPLMSAECGPQPFIRHTVSGKCLTGRTDMFQVLLFRGGELSLLAIGQVGVPAVNAGDQEPLSLVVPRGADYYHACCYIHMISVPAA